MKEHQAVYPIRAMCRVLGLSPSGYYAWLRRPMSARARRDAELTAKICEVYEANHRVYGRPRIHAELHSDQGSQYTSIAFGMRCKEVGVRPSMGSVGDAYDNALCESFFATLECEPLDQRRFHSQAEARLAVFDFIEGFYYPRRRHSALDQRSPIRFEREAECAACSCAPGYPGVALQAAAARRRRFDSQ